MLVADTSAPSSPEPSLPALPHTPEVIAASLFPTPAVEASDEEPTQQQVAVDVTDAGKHHNAESEGEEEFIVVA